MVNSGLFVPVRAYCRNGRFRKQRAVPGSTSLPLSFTAAVLVAAALSGCARCVECTGTEVAPMPLDEDGVAAALPGVPADYGLGPMDVVRVRPGASERRGNVEISCPAGGAACVVSVSDDGTVEYDRTGGRPAIAPWTPAPEEIDDILNRRARKTRLPDIFSFGGAVVTCKALGCPVPEAIHVDHAFRVHGRFDFSGFEFIGRRGQVSLAGKTRVSEQAGHSSSHRSLGGWMEHSFFLVEAVNAGHPSEFVWRTYSMGYSANTSPDVSVSGTATWSGIMSGVVTSRSRHAGSFVAGDAVVTITDLESSSDASVDVEFGNIVREDTGTELGNMTWKSLALNGGGFGTGNVVHNRGGGYFGENGDRISRGEGIFGQFYGKNHEEVGGLFNRHGIAGAFAARREAGEPPALLLSAPPD